MSWVLSWVVGVALALVTGTASALLPVVNAEVYAVAAAGRSSSWTAAVVVVALAVGQTIGKLLLFQAARRGGGRLSKWAVGHTSTRAGRWTERIRRALGSRRTGNPLVLASATLGLPPLAAVSLAAGAAGQRRWEFALLCLTGRTVRFAAIVLPAAWGSSVL